MPGAATRERRPGARDPISGLQGHTAARTVGTRGGAEARIPEATEPHHRRGGPRPAAADTREPPGPATPRGQTPRDRLRAEVHGDAPTTGRASNRNQHTPGARARQHTGTRTHRGLWSKPHRDPYHHEARNHRLGSNLSLPRLTAEAGQQRKDTTHPENAHRRRGPAHKPQGVVSAVKPQDGMLGEARH